ncbi:hypothetical protein R1flu_007260 [Riccia fluitans]|uniref:DDE Tnp4 domain-containing protein n=1 Tax=Riccia fluitans TaxID=41844 RepID=A0ABD1YYX6_9MARC
MPKHIFQLLVTNLAPVVTRADTQFRRAIPTDVRIASVLFKLATSMSYFKVGEHFGVGLATVQEFMPEVITAIIRVLDPSYLSWPRGESMLEVSQKFERTCGLPNIHGAIDCTFVRVWCPQDQAGCFFHRKWYTSIVLQAVADNDATFLDISCGFPGSVHDQRVLRRSLFLQKVEGGEILIEPVLTLSGGVRLSPYILGDSGYALQPWLMTPISLTPHPPMLNVYLQHDRSEVVSVSNALLVF